MDDQGTNRASGGIRFRKVRIAWSVAFGILCMLLIALWVRSGWYVDRALISYAPQRPVLIESFKGRILITEFMATSSWNWRFFSLRSDAEFRDAGRWSYVAHATPLENGTVLPSWPAVLAAAALTVAPWLPPRFSLRTMLIVVTIIALLLGIAAYLVR